MGEVFQLRPDDLHRELETNLRVCPHCGYHMRIPARRRLEMLFDDASFNVVELPEAPIDPLKFRDRKRYTDRLREAQANPEEYRHLIVRVAGYSDYFCDLSTALQDEIIARTEHQAF